MKILTALCLLVFEIEGMLPENIVNSDRTMVVPNGFAPLKPSDDPLDKDETSESPLELFLHTVKSGFNITSPEEEIFDSIKFSIANSHKLFISPKAFMDQCKKIPETYRNTDDIVFPIISFISKKPLELFLIEDLVENINYGPEKIKKVHDVLRFILKKPIQVCTRHQEDSSSILGTFLIQKINVKASRPSCFVLSGNTGTPKERRGTLPFLWKKINDIDTEPKKESPRIQLGVRKQPPSPKGF
jgi:hypothetical protein